MKFQPWVNLLAVAGVVAGRWAAAQAPGDFPVQHGPGDGTVAASPDAQNAIKSFQFDQGLKAELFAAEPLLANPVSFAVDEKGRWFIAETYRQERGVEDNRAHGNWLNEDTAARTVEDRLAMIKKFYPDPAKFAEKFTKFEDRITRVEDTNGDGVADKTTVFADGFREPLDGTGAGLLARGHDLWWTCIPNLWRLRDTDGDGKAEEKEKLLGGFGVKYAYRGHDMHGLRFGPDGKLYFSIGDRGINVTSKEGRTFAEPDTGSVMRCNPDGTGFEVFATGFRNPQELAFDEFGNLFTADNNSDAGDKARFLYLVEGGDCGWRTTYQYLNDRGPWNREMLWDEKLAPAAKYILPPVANIGNGPSGLTYNPGTGLSDKHAGRFYLSDFRGGGSASVVHQIALEPVGAGFKVRERRDFIKGVLTTDVEFGNEGALYVLDWVEGWSGVNKGRIYRFTDTAANAALQASTKKLIEEGMNHRPDVELVQHLAHPDMRVRMAAQFALALKGVAAMPVVAKAAQNGPTVLARLHAIWALGQMGEQNIEAAAPLLPLLSDPEAEVRAQAAKVLGERKTAVAGDLLVALLKDPSPRVRMFAALSLGKIAHRTAVEPLFAMVAENNDQGPILRHAGVMGLAGCAASEQLAAKAKDPNLAVRIGAVVALRRQKSSALAAFLNDSDELVVLETARAIHDAPVDQAMPELAALVSVKNTKNLHILSRVVNANYRLGQAAHARALAEFAAEASAPEVARRDALEALGLWANPSERDRLLHLWRPLPQRTANDAVVAVTPLLTTLLGDATPGSIQEAAAKLAATLAIGAAGEPLARLAMNGKTASTARIAALKALVDLKDQRLAEAAKAAVADKDSKVRTAGLQALTGQDPAMAIAAIGEILQRGEPLEKQGALVALTQIKRPEANALLVELMDKLIAGQEAPEIQLDIYEAAKGADTPELKERLAKYAASLPPNDPLAPYKLALAGGHVDRGRKLFREKVEVQCLRCHKAEIGDSLVGPDLTKIGAQKDRLYLLESIIFPNRTVAAGFQIVTFTMKDGNVIVGRVLGEEGGNLKIETLDEQGKPKTVTVVAADVKERGSAPSPMPENIRDQLSKAELRDLVEYLATRK